MRALTLLSLSTLAFSLPTSYGPPPPSLSTCKAFTLIAKVLPSSASSPLAPLVDSRILIAAHVGAGFNVAVLYPQNYTNGAVFYQAGTPEEVASGRTIIINDQARPLSPFPMSIQGPEEFDLTYPTQHSVLVNVVDSSHVSFEQKAGVQALKNGLDVSGEGTFAVCNNTVPYYRSVFWTLMYVYGDEELAEECVEVVMVPKCAVLEDLPEGSFSSHELAVEVGCYETVEGLVVGEEEEEDEE
ncbi:hypothetical protein QBC34DRAFT_401284 [Podospora aff. communis PSN243]|uniref:DUF7907 domain-containing protein n=1 Tax=Podospora aff. communis PSN243 TaxID=3040156 RepID=A0AAV9GTB2_9PEZI|nr:hypothetical protein QBC34DRAFT_401284 [Podospora aff. communis PSN243]